MPYPSSEVLVAHPVPLLACGLAAALAPDAHLVDADASFGQLLSRPAPALLVTDLGRALAVLAQARPVPGQAFRPWPCLVVSAEVGSCQVRQALQAGVLGFLHASCGLDELRLGVAAARRGQRFLCQVAATGMAEALSDEALTPRETEVLLLLCQGLDNKSIAQQLAMALGTVKTHVKAILDKLGVSSRTQAVAAAHRRGLARRPVDAAPPARPPWLPAAAASNRRQALPEGVQ